MRLGSMLSPELRQALRGAAKPAPTSTNSTAYTDVREGVRVHRKHTTIVAPPEPDTWKPRMGNKPHGPKSSMGVVCEELRSFNPKSACVAFQSYESRHYPLRRR